MEEKLKLVTLKKDAWHAKLLRYMFGSDFNDPTDMLNLCPYFWLLIAAMLLVPFKVVLYEIPKFIFKPLIAYIDFMTESYVQDFTIEDYYKHQVMEYYIFGKDVKASLEQIPWYMSKRKFNRLKKEAERKYISKTGGEAWKEMRAARDNVRKRLEELRNNRIYKKREAKKQLKNNFSDMFESITENVQDFFDNIAEFFKNMFSFNNSAKIIKTTKNIVGGIVGLGLAALTYLFVHCIVYIIMELIGIWDWTTAGWAFLFIAAAILFGYIITLTSRAINNLKQKVANGADYWFINLPIWLYEKIAAPFVLYLIIVPVKFIFFTVLWQILCYNIIWGGIKGIGKGLVSFGGIFGEYFGSSYTDYCPGIEWEKED